MHEGKVRRGDRVSEYILEEKIGAGGFGEVWKAVHAHLPDEVAAVKIPTNPDFIENLRREGAILHALRGRHIVEVKGLDPYADPPYLVMEYVSGKSLRELMAGAGSFPPEDALPIFRQCLKALKEAHARGVIHRDVKPENILIDPGGCVKLTDFGLGRAREAAASEVLQSGALGTVGTAAGIAGTLRYMSPEQREGAPVDARTDLYALGMILFEMLSGDIPQGAEKPSDMRKDLPPWVDRVFSGCYTRLEKRYADAGAALEDLDGHLRQGRKKEPRPDIVYLDEMKVSPPPPVAVRSARPRPPLWMLPFYGLHALGETFADGVKKQVRSLQQGEGTALIAVAFLALLAVGALVVLAGGGAPLKRASSPAASRKPRAAASEAARLFEAYEALRDACRRDDWKGVWAGLSEDAKSRIAYTNGSDREAYSPEGEWQILRGLMRILPGADPPEPVALLQAEPGPGRRVEAWTVSEHQGIVKIGRVGSLWVKQGGAWKLDREASAREARPARETPGARSGR